MQRLEPETTALIVIDVQERLSAAMPPAQLEALARSAGVLLEASRVLGVPVLATEQYPKGLGPTLPELAGKLQAAGASRFEKLTFSACEAEGFLTRLAESRVRAAVLIGMEAHVCVYQTARDLVERGYAVHVPIDGVASRRDDHREAGIALCERAGAVRTTTETIVFDWLRRAGSDVFRELSKLLR